VTNALFCNQKEMVDAYFFIFENPWRQAIAAQIRIKELEKGIPPEVLQIINEFYEIVFKMFS
jgi:hypothetical protein